MPVPVHIVVILLVRRQGILLGDALLQVIPQDGEADETVVQDRLRGPEQTVRLLVAAELTGSFLVVPVVVLQILLQLHLDNEGVLLFQPSSDVVVRDVLGNSRELYCPPVLEGEVSLAGRDLVLPAIVDVT